MHVYSMSADKASLASLEVQSVVVWLCQLADLLIMPSEP